jgi:FkbM family methyltransferase
MKNKLRHLERELLLRAWQRMSLRRRALIRQSDGDVVRLDYPRKDIFLHVDSHIDLRRARSCEKEPGTIQWLEEDVEAGSVLFDIGANVGAYSLVAWAKSGGSTKVYAFEPGVTTFPQLCRNIVLNRATDSIVPLNIALSSRHELQAFKYNSLLAGAGEHLGLEENSSTSNRGAEVAFSQPVVTYSLDDVIRLFELPAPHHIKIDVDGHEYGILQGATRVLESGALRTMQIEIGEADPFAAQIKSLLAVKGFRIKRVSRHGDGPLADYVFEKA